jgi:hypothetical protein
MWMGWRSDATLTVLATLLDMVRFPLSFADRVTGTD